MIQEMWVDYNWFLETNTKLQAQCKSLFIQTKKADAKSGAAADDCL